MHPGGTQVELTWHSKRSEHIQKAQGIVFSPVICINDFYLAFFITDRNTASFKSTATDFAPPTGKDESTARIKPWVDGDNSRSKPYDVTIPIKPNDTVYKQKLATVNIMDSAAAEHWRSHLLNQQPIEIEENHNPSRCPKAKKDETAWKANIDSAYHKDFRPAGDPDFSSHTQPTEDGAKPLRT